MTDDLVKKLREVGGFERAAELCSYAADRIQQLEAGNKEFAFLRNDDLARIKELESQLVRLRAAMDDILSYVSRADYHYMEPHTIEVMREILGGNNG